ncbi:resolution of meiotic recombination intermediate [Fragilaria crotonensis]|nr:resolution of meiotic recombination intermediate [Fragilaria crotonensis]
MAPTESRRKAVHPANQEGLDRLYDKCEQASTAQSSKFVFAVRKAAKALQACPTAVTTMKEAKALRGVGDSLARIIVPKPTEMNIALSRASSVATTASTTANDAESSTTTTAKTKNLKPRNKALSDGKMDAPKPSEKLKAYQNAVKESESLILPSGDWRVVLIVDGREHGWEKVLADLQMSGIPSEKRNLPIGDMAWIARSGTLEIMLGTIVERKEVNDLASSLFGTRYKEQRLRLQHCGLPQVILLVEGDTKEVSNCSHESLHMAMMETRVQLDFQVVRTRHLEETVRFLKSVHRRILQRAFPSAFSDGVTSSSSFITYNELKCKVEKDREEGTKTIGGIFCRMLKQIPRISNSTVPPLVHAYPTPDALFRALDGLNVSDGKNLLADLETGTQRVGELRALEVYYTFMAGGDDSVITGSPPRATLTENLPNCDADISSSQEETTIVEQGDPESTNVVFAAHPKLPETQTLTSRTLSKDTPSIPSAEAIDLLDSPSPSSDESDGSFPSKIESSKSDHASSPKQRPLLGPCTSWKISEIRGSPSLLMPSTSPSPGFAGRSVLEAWNQAESIPVHRPRHEKV